MSQSVVYIGEDQRGFLMLHITNGDSAKAAIEMAGLGGTVLPWQDVLHEGPVPAGLSLAQLRGIRAAFIANQGWGTYDKILAQFVQRDEIALRASEYEQVYLWFEHDLFDQLQLIQVLSVLSDDALHRCAIVQPGRSAYISQLSADALRLLFGQKHPVTDAQLAVARRAWDAFRSPDPALLLAFLREDTAALPSVAPALLRLGQQYPSLENGLNRTERQILEVLAVGPYQVLTLYAEAHQKREELVFMGDTVFATYVQELSKADAPLIQIEERKVTAAGLDSEFWKADVRITNFGRAVLKGEEDVVRTNGIDRWLGGVYLSGNEVPWRWDERHKTLRARG
jgi:hypothetical protein